MESTQLCYDCAFKHLSCAQTAWTEVYNGYMQPDHIAKIVGNLTLAEEHLLERHKDISESIRQGRKDWWDAVTQGMVYRPPFEEWLQQVWELILTDLHIDGGVFGNEEDELDG